MRRIHLSGKTLFSWFAGISCFVMACDSPVTKSTPGADTAFAVPDKNAGGSDSSSSGSSPSNSGDAGATKQLTFNKESYNVKPDGEKLIIKIISSPGAMPDSTVQAGFTGILYDAEIADLDNDHQPEIYAFTHSSGDNNYGSVFGVAFNGHKGTPITFADLSPAVKGYAGQDSFYVDSLHRLLVRQFPVTDSASKRVTPVVRTIKYKLNHAGEKYQLLPVKP